MTVVGLDLHKRYITACALDNSGTYRERGTPARDVDCERARLTGDVRAIMKIAVADPVMRIAATTRSLIGPRGKTQHDIAISST